MSTPATDLDSLRELLDNFRHIQRSPAFARWKEAVEGQMNGRRAEASAPMKTIEAAMERNFMNGEGAGIQLAIQMWNLLSESLEEDINALLPPDQKE